MKTLFNIKSYVVVLLKTISSLIRVLLKSKFNLGQKIHHFDFSPGTIIRVLGNGKSLSEVELTYNDKIDYLVVNRHVLASNYTVIKPKYYVFADPHFYNTDEGMDLLNRIKEVTNWKMRIFFPYSPKHKKSITYDLCENKLLDVVFYNNTLFLGFEKMRYFMYQRNWGVPAFQNVLAASVYLSIMMNYNRVELYGVEHSWLKNLIVNENNEVCLLNPHFYDKSESKLKTWKEIQGHDIKLHQAIRLYALMFESYHELQSYAQKKGSTIINCTKDSYIDAFQRN